MTTRQLLIFLLGSTIPSLLVAVAATAVVRSLAPRWGLVDRPAARKVHTTPTALGGGIGIYLGIVLPLLIGWLLVFLLRSSDAQATWLPDFVQPHLTGIAAQGVKLGVLFAAVTMLMLLGLADDIRGVPWFVRLGVQTLVASMCVWWVDDLRLTAFLPYPVLTSGLSVLWIVGLINSFNMLDNMDGLSAGVATIAAGMLAAILLLAPDPTTHQPQLFVAGLLLIVIGSSLGFLWHNRPPAAIFMGDAGSYVLGFSLAVASLLATYASYRTRSLVGDDGGVLLTSGRHTVLAPLCVLAVPLYDMLSVIAIRLAARRSPFEADKNHFSHRLVDLGLTKPQAVATIYLTTATCGLGGLLLQQVNAIGAAVIVLLIGCVLCVIAIIETAARRKVLAAIPRDAVTVSAGQKV